MKLRLGGRVAMFIWEDTGWKETAEAPLWNEFPLKIGRSAKCGIRCPSTWELIDDEHLHIFVQRGSDKSTELYPEIRVKNVAKSAGKQGGFVWVRKRLLRPGQEAVLSNGDVIDLFCMRLLVNTFVKTADDWIHELHGRESNLSIGLINTAFRFSVSLDEEQKKKAIEEILGYIFHYAPPDYESPLPADLSDSPPVWPSEPLLVLPPEHKPRLVTDLALPFDSPCIPAPASTLSPSTMLLSRSDGSPGMPFTPSYKLSSDHPYLNPPTSPSLLSTFRSSPAKSSPLLIGPSAAALAPPSYLPLSLSAPAADSAATSVSMAATNAPSAIAPLSLPKQTATPSVPSTSDSVPALATFSHVNSPPTAAPSLNAPAVVNIQSPVAPSPSPATPPAQSSTTASPTQIPPSASPPAPLSSNVTPSPKQETPKRKPSTSHKIYSYALAKTVTGDKARSRETEALLAVNHRWLLSDSSPRLHRTLAKPPPPPKNRERGGEQELADEEEDEGPTKSSPAKRTPQKSKREKEEVEAEEAMKKRKKHDEEQNTKTTSSATSTPTKASAGRKEEEEEERSASKSPSTERKAKKQKTEKFSEAAKAPKGKQTEEPTDPAEAAVQEALRKFRSDLRSFSRPGEKHPTGAALVQLLEEVLDATALRQPIKNPRPLKKFRDLVRSNWCLYGIKQFILLVVTSCQPEPHSWAALSARLDSFAKPTDFLQAVISVFEKGLELHPELLSDALTIWDIVKEELHSKLRGVPV